ncbi:metalloregulator ArsR/SmtB family transcription factor [Prescottella defluvii]|uniref:ArsR/SmtB family transcription factor n=1 Tax=Prescottella defluvii TaxID=1323361 RepID=UPI0004F28059|nr:metalloregulator ArsR/SmtB family transcription factor [Prescottella defluvii]
MNVVESDEGMYDQLARVAKAMANGRRLALLELMAQGEQSVETLARASALKTTSASAHLQILKSAGLVRTRRDGTTIYYRLSGLDVARLYVSMKDVGAAHLPGLAHSDGPEFSDELAAQMSSGSVVVLDVRPLPEFTAGHLPGALSIPLEELGARADELPAGVHVVVYCRGELCGLARDAADLLRRRGRSAAAMDEGILEWRASGVELARPGGDVA